MSAKTFYDFLLAQFAAESYLDNVELSTTAENIRLEERLKFGSNHYNPEVPLKEDEVGATRMTDLMVQDFFTKWEIIDHYPNDESGFSATLLKNKLTDKYTLSFRSTESKPQEKGGDVERDSSQGANGEISDYGFAHAQIWKMEQYFKGLENGTLKSGTAADGAAVRDYLATDTINVTGYSLGGHLAQVFTQMHYENVNETYIYNGAGMGLIDGVSGNPATGAALRERTNLLAEAFLNPETVIDKISVDQWLDLGLTAAQAADPVRALIQLKADREEHLASIGEDEYPRIYDDPLYQYAVLSLPETTGAFFVSLNEYLSGESRSNDHKITNLYGNADYSDTEFVAGSGLIFGDFIPVFIEDQPEITGNPIGTSLDYLLRAFGPTHSITLIADSLLVMDLFQRLDPDASQNTIEAILSASSNQRAGLIAIGQSAEGDSLERALDALGRLFVGPSWTETEAERTPGSFGDIELRDGMHEQIGLLRENDLFQQVTGLLTLKDLSETSVSDLVDGANSSGEEGLAYRYALQNLIPFALIGDDAIYTDHNATKALNLSDESANGMTKRYIEDRASFLSGYLQLNHSNDLSNHHATTEDPYTLFRDLQDGQEISIGSGTPIFPQPENFAQVRFGTDGDDRNGDLEGGAKDDRLYGGAGNDELIGGGGSDYLEGGLGDDTYHVDGGDTIFDSDGEGSVSWNSKPLTGGVRFADNGVEGGAVFYRNSDDNVVYELTGDKLRVFLPGETGSGTVTVENFEEGELGIRLYEDANSVPEPAIVHGTSEDNLIRLEERDDGTLYFDTKLNGSKLGDEAIEQVADIAQDLQDAIAQVDAQIAQAGASDALEDQRAELVRQFEARYGNLLDQTGKSIEEIVADDGDDRVIITSDPRLSGLKVHGGVGEDLLIGDAETYWENIFATDLWEVPESQTGSGVEFHGGQDNDHLIGSARSDWLNGDSGKDVLKGHGGIDKLFGGTGDDWLAGGDDRDLLVGGADHDVLTGGDSGDTLVGGAGKDHLYGDGNAEPLSTQWTREQLSNGNTGFTLAFGELNSPDIKGDDWLFGDAGDDFLVGGAGDDYLDGGDDDDELQGDNGRNLSITGNDELHGGAGEDELYGGPGKDKLYGEKDDDDLFGGDHDDTLYGGAGKDVLVGEAGNDTLSGGADRDFLLDHSGNERYIFDAGWGIDTILDTDGTDTVEFGAGVSPSALSATRMGDDLVIHDQSGANQVRISLWYADATNRIEAVQFSDGTVWTEDVLTAKALEPQGTDGDDQLVGIEGTANTLTGGAGDDTLRGQGLDDILDGGVGDDVLAGGRGNDMLIGGAGNDTYVIGSGVGIDTLIDEGVESGINTVRFAPGKLPRDVTPERSGDDLILRVGGEDTGAIVKNYYRNPSAWQLELASGTPVDVETLFNPPDSEEAFVQNAWTAFEETYYLDLQARADERNSVGSGLYAPLNEQVVYQRFVPNPLPDIPMSSHSTQSLGDYTGEAWNWVGGSPFPRFLHKVELVTTHGTAAREELLREQSSVFDNYTLDGRLLLRSNVSSGATVSSGTGSTTARFNVMGIQFGSSGDSHNPLDSGSGLRVPVPVLEETVQIQRIYAGDGADRIGNSHTIGNAISLVDGGNGNDILRGGDHADFLHGGNGDDVLVGGFWDDLLLGGNGNDQMDGGFWDDVLLGMEGDDVLRDFAGRNLMQGGAGADRLDAGGKDHYQEGSLLDGGSGGDQVLDSLNEDLIVGGRGNDRLTRVGGEDVVLFNRGDGHDTVLLDRSAAMDVPDLSEYMPSESRGHTLYQNSAAYPEKYLGFSPSFGTPEYGEITPEYGGVGPSYVESSATLSLGGGVVAQELALRRAGDNLILEVGGTDSLTLEGWYQFRDGPALEGGSEYDEAIAAGGYTVGWISVLQIISEIGEDGELGTADPQTNGRVQQYDFQLLTRQFTQALEADPSIERWHLGDTLPEAHIVSHDDRAIGGDLAYQYAVRGSLGGIGSQSAWDVLNAPEFGRSDQALSSVDTGLNALSDGLVTLRDGAPPMNHAPVLKAPLTDRQALEDEVVTFQIPANTFTDADAGDSLTYSARLADGSDLPAWLAFDPTTRTFTGQPANSNVGALEIRVSATDSEDALVTDTFVLTVVNTNDAPLLAAPVSDQTAVEDAVFTFVLPDDSFSDEDLGDELRYSATRADGTPLPDWLLFDPATGVFIGTPGNDEVGSLEVRVTATDSGGLSAQDTFTLNVENVNDAPVVAKSIGGTVATEDEPFAFQIPPTTFRDVDLGDNLTFSATLADGSPLPAWLTFNASTQTFSGTPVNDDVGVLAVDVTATDSEGLRVSDTFSLAIANVNDAPTLEQPVVDVTTMEDASFSYKLPADTFADVDVGDVLTYSATLADGSELPMWLSFDPNTQAFTGTPLNEDVGGLDVKVTATDIEGHAISDTFTLTVENVNDAPVIVTEVEDQVTLEDALFTFQVPSETFADVDVGDSLSYSATLADGLPLPAWLTFDPETQTFSGLPENDHVGALDLEVTATDSEGATVSDTFSVTVVNVNDAPAVGTPLADQPATEDEAFSYQIPANAFADVDVGDTLTYTAKLSDGADLPAWLSFDPSTYTFSGTPANDDVGVVDVRVTATDTGGLSVSENFTLTVENVNDAPTVAIALTDQAGMEYAPFTYQVPGNAFDDVDVGDSLSYTASLTDGSPLPDWLAFDAETLTLAGSPTGDDLGSMSVTITATDTSGISVSDAFTLAVNENPAAIKGTSDKKNKLDGTAGDDILVGRQGKDDLRGGAGDDLAIAGAGDDKLRGGDGADVLMGGDGKDTLEGDEGNDTLEGGAGEDHLQGGNGNDVLSGGAGDDTLEGEAGSDTYVFGRDFGHDTIIEKKPDAGDVDEVMFGEDIAPDQLWFSRDKDHLDIGILGTDDELTIEKWYKKADNRVEEFHTANGSVLYEAQVQQLVNAMAAFNPPSSGNLDLSPQEQERFESAIAANWQSV